MGYYQSGINLVYCFVQVVYYDYKNYKGNLSFSTIY